MIRLILCVGLAALLHQPAAQGSEQLASLMTTNEDQQKMIVDKHNELRRGVQPPASNMVKMEWSPELASSSQKWADQCLFKHSDGTINGESYGENLYMSSSPVEWNVAIQAWYDEVQNFDYASGAKTKGAVIGHYTQVVWYISYLIGCAVAFCPDELYQYYFVCQYSPPGNIQGRIATPYEAGDPCGHCPDACDNGLCTNPCKERNVWGNCAKLKDQVGCSHPIMEKCGASCKCTKEII